MCPGSEIGIGLRMLCARFVFIGPVQMSTGIARDVLCKLRDSIHRALHFYYQIKEYNPATDLVYDHFNLNYLLKLTGLPLRSTVVSGVPLSILDHNLLHCGQCPVRHSFV